jgi:hypothetical protein
VSIDGRVTREKFGETTVLVRYLDQQVPVTLDFVPARPDFAWSAPKPNNFIDDLVFQKLRSLRINPSAVCDDATFVRRAYLDLLGVVPTEGTARSFVADQDPNKRVALVDRLMTRGEFADFWALKWADLLRIEERQLDQNGMKVFHDWIRESIAANKPLDQFARELVAARGSTYQNPPANWYRANRDPVQRAENTARVFLGTQLNCAQCHNHPFEKWTQDDYYSWAAGLRAGGVRDLGKQQEGQERPKGIQGRPGREDREKGQRDQCADWAARKADVARSRRARGDSDHDELMAAAEWLSRSPLFARCRRIASGSIFSGVVWSIRSMISREQSALASGGAGCAREGFRGARLRSAAPHSGRSCSRERTSSRSSRMRRMPTTRPSSPACLYAGWARSRSWTARARRSACR